MKFIVTPEIFEKLPNLYVGVVVAKEVDNSQDYPKINELLNKYMNFSQERFDGVNVKENGKLFPIAKLLEKLVLILIVILVLPKLCLNVYQKEKIYRILIHLLI